MEARRSTRHPVQRPMHGSAVGLPWPRRSGRPPTPRARGVARLATLSMPWRQSSPGSRPSCGARAIAQAKACPDLAIASWRTPSPPTHFRSVRANRRRVRAVVLTAARSWPSDPRPRWLPETPRRRAAHAWIPEAPPTEHLPAWTCLPAIRCPPARRSANSSAVHFAARRRQRCRTLLGASTPASARHPALPHPLPRRRRKDRGPADESPGQELIVDP